LAFGALSCSSDDGGGSQTGSCESDIPWFQPGKYAKYKMTQFGFDAGTMTLTFGECNGTGFESPMEFRDAAGNITQTVSNTFWIEDGYLTNDSGNDGIDLHRIFKKDAQLNDTWTDIDEDDAVITHTVVDMDSLITVPAGSFHCKVFLREKSDIINTSHIFWHETEGQIMEDAQFFKMELMENNN